MSQENEDGTARYFAMYHGTVVRNDDPEKLSRVRCELPGLIDLTAWAWPMGAAGGGGARRGAKMTPRVGADVTVFFKIGDIDHPFYLPGPWGKPGGVTEVPGGGLTPPTAETVDAVGDEDLTSETAPQVDYLETESFIISVDERRHFSGQPGKGSLYIRSKLSGDRLEYDGESNAWIIEASGTLALNSRTLVSINAPGIQLNGRSVRTSEDPI